MCTRLFPAGRKHELLHWQGDDCRKRCWWHLVLTFLKEVISPHLSKSTSTMNRNTRYYTRLSLYPQKSDSYLKRWVWLRITVEVHCGLFFAEEIFNTFWNCLQKLKTRPTVEDAAIFAIALPPNYPQCVCKLYFLIVFYKYALKLYVCILDILKLCNLLYTHY